MSAEELTEWEAYFELEPFGAWAENLNTGILASLIYNVNRSSKSVSVDAMSMALGDFDRPKKKQSMNEMKELLMQMMKSKQQ